MSFFDIFKIDKIKEENKRLNIRVSYLEKQLSDLGFTEYEQTKNAIDSMNKEIKVIKHLSVGKSVALTVGVSHRLGKMHVARVVLIEYLIEAVLRLFFVALLRFKIQRVPLCLPLAVHCRQIDHRIVFALVLGESSCDSFHIKPPSELTSYSKQLYGYAPS